MNPEATSPPTSIPKSEDQYFLLAILLDPNPSEPTSPQRLRFHSAAHPVVVLHPEPPKLIRFHTQTPLGNETNPDPNTAPGSSSKPAQIIATSWNERHAGRTWGVVLHQSDEAGPRQWEEVRIVEGQGDAVFRWVKAADGVEELVCHGEGEGAWAGWMVCDWNMGLRQLFWVAKGGIDALPLFCQRVRIGRERVWGQPERPQEEGRYEGAG